MTDWLRRTLRIKTDAEIAREVSEEPSIKNARRALARVQKWTGVTDDLLERYEAAETARQGRQP